LANVYLRKSLHEGIIKLGEDVTEYVNKAVKEKLKEEGVDVE